MIQSVSSIGRGENQAQTSESNTIDNESYDDPISTQQVSNTTICILASLNTLILLP